MWRDFHDPQPDIHQRRLNYWMEKLDIYSFCECMYAAQTHFPIRKALKSCGYAVPKWTGKQIREFKKHHNKNNHKYVTALDDWYPSFRNGKVSVSLHDDGHISVWGDDDFGMRSTKQYTKEQFEKFCAEPISQERCKKEGFQPD